MDVTGSELNANMPENCSDLPIGTVVRVHSLSARSELNGLRGHVAAQTKDRGRLVVSLDGLAHPLAVHSTNLTPATPATVGSEHVLTLVGTSSLISEHIVLRIRDLVNIAYGYARLSARDVVERLAMGDAGAQANRVLHVGWRDGHVVGCCSSTLCVGWVPRGCGHWGLLSVAQEAQGTGVASALVAAAEARVREAGLRFVQMEYDFVAGDPLSERLYKWYEGKLGFRALSGRPPPSTPGERQWRSCRKCLA